MRKILTRITLEEKNKCLSLIAIHATYLTLLKISRYDLDKIEIKRKLENVEDQIDSFWFNITNKYQIPFYADKQLKMDDDQNYLYIDE